MSRKTHAAGEMGGEEILALSCCRYARIISIVSLRVVPIRVPSAFEIRRPPQRLFLRIRIDARRTFYFSDDSVPAPSRPENKAAACRFLNASNSG